MKLLSESKLGTTAGTERHGESKYAPDGCVLVLKLSKVLQIVKLQAKLALLVN